MSQFFDPNNGTFTFTFAANLTLAQTGTPSIIYLNEKLYYPSGYNVRYSHVPQLVNYKMHEPYTTPQATMSGIHMPQLVNYKMHEPYNA